MAWEYTAQEALFVLLKLLEQVMQINWNCQTQGESYFDSIYSCVMITASKRFAIDILFFKNTQIAF